MASRMSFLKEDFEITKQQCGNTKGCPFQGFELGENFCHFMFKDGIVEKEYKIHFSDEYPEMHLNLAIPLPGTNNNTSESRLSDGGLSDDCESDDYDDYYASGDETGALVYEMNPALEDDLENLRDTYGDDSMKYVLFDSIDGIDVEFIVPLDFLDREVVKAWRLSDEPLIIRINFSLSRYLDATRPPVKVYQPSQNKFGIGSQLEKILEEFLSVQWKELSNERLRRESKPVRRRDSPQREVQHRKRISSGSEDVPRKSPQPVECDVSDKALAEVLDMGFDTTLSRNALIIAHNNVQEAIEILVCDPARCASGPRSPVFEGSGTANVLADRGLPVPHSPPTAKQAKTSTSLHNKHGKGVKHKDKGLGKSNLLGRILNFFPHSLGAGTDSKSIPSLQHGFLVQPAVCGGQLCVFSFQTLGVMSEAADDIATGAAVVDLLIAMANAACRSQRRETIFEPYPTVIDPVKPTELAFNPNEKDYAKVEKTLDKFLTTNEMAQLDATNLKKNMDARNVLAYPLLQWIINSNRSHIVKLPEEKQISFMKTPHQFLLMSSPPAKEAAFRQAKEKHGSIFAFHGSVLENWHSIMRVGLINASGTKYQMHGAAYGKGIYLSPKAQISFGYCGGAFGGRPHLGSKKIVGAAKPAEPSSDNFLRSANRLTCIALCEVVNSAELSKSADIWVMKNDDHVCTRFFFVYESGIDADCGIDATKEPYKKEIATAVSFSYR